MKSFPIFVETKGRSCDGCKKCCEGWLTANIYGFAMNPTDGPCRFLAKTGCGIYPVRESLCKVFQCDWKENNLIPYNMKPDLSNVIMMTKRLDKWIYIRFVLAGKDMSNHAYEYAKQLYKQGKNVVYYDNSSKLQVLSNDQAFIDKITPQLTLI